jgi:hypothetical protein
MSILTESLYRHGFYTKHIEAGWKRAASAGIITTDIERVIMQQAKKGNSSSYNAARTRNSSPQEDRTAIPVLSIKDLATTFALMLIGYACSIACLIVEIVTQWLKTFRKRNQRKTDVDTAAIIKIDTLKSK